MNVIVIRDLSQETKIKKYLKNLIPESISIHQKYVKFVSLNANIKLYCKDFEQILLYGCPYLAMKIILNNDESIENINRQFLSSIEWGYLEIAKLLMDLGGNHDEAIAFAASNGDLEMVQFLIKKGADIHTNYDLPLVWASMEGHLEVVKLLIKSGANVLAQDNEALIMATKKGHLEVVRLLIANGAEVEAQDNKAIINASKLGNYQMIKLLVKSGADVSVKKYRPLYNALDAGHSEEILDLLR